MSRQESIERHFAALERAVASFKNEIKRDNTNRAAAAATIHTLAEFLRESVVQAHKGRKGVKKPRDGAHQALAEDVQSVEDAFDRQAPP